MTMILHLLRRSMLLFHHLAPLSISSYHFHPHQDRVREDHLEFSKHYSTSTTQTYHMSCLQPVWATSSKNHNQVELHGTRPPSTWCQCHWCHRLYHQDSNWLQLPAVDPLNMVIFRDAARRRTLAILRVVRLRCSYNCWRRWRRTTVCHDLTQYMRISLVETAVPMEAVFNTLSHCVKEKVTRFLATQTWNVSTASTKDLFTELQKWSVRPRGDWSKYSFSCWMTEGRTHWSSVFG